MVGTSIQVSINVSFLLVDLVGEGSIRKLRDGNIQEGNKVVLLGFHGKLYAGRKDIKMIEERNQVGMANRPNDKHVIYKSKPTFGFEMKVV